MKFLDTTGASNAHSWRGISMIVISPLEKFPCMIIRIFEYKVNLLTRIMASLTMADNISKWKLFSGDYLGDYFQEHFHQLPYKIRCLDKHFLLNNVELFFMWLKLYSKIWDKKRAFLKKFSCEGVDFVILYLIIYCQYPYIFIDIWSKPLYV